MSDLDNIVTINITRETTTVKRTSFGTEGILAEFATSKTTATFDRYRTYASLTEMSNDGWDIYDPVYLAAQKVFAQNPSVDTVFIGRKDSGDASWTAALTAIQNASSDWYNFSITDDVNSLVTFADDFVTSNSIVATVNGVAAGAVVFTTDMQATMALLETAMELLTGVTVTVGATPYQTMVVEQLGEKAVVSFAITLGATQTTYTTAAVDTVTQAEIVEVSDWTETQKKLFSYSDSNADIKNPALATDSFSVLKAKNYDRTYGMYMNIAASFAETAWPGETLPYNPGSQTWAYKTLAGVASYELTSAERTAVLAKNANIYTLTGGVDVTEEGKVVGGEWIDIIRGTDWIESRMQEEIFTNLVNKRKIPFTNDGIAIFEGAVLGVLNEASEVDRAILVASSIVVTVPLASEVSSTDKNNRNLPDIVFSATYQGAIQKTTITGTISV